MLTVATACNRALEGCTLADSFGRQLFVFCMYYLEVFLAPNRRDDYPIRSNRWLSYPKLPGRSDGCLTWRSRVVGLYSVRHLWRFVPLRSRHGTYTAAAVRNDQCQYEVRSIEKQHTLVLRILLLLYGQMSTERTDHGHHVRLEAKSY